MEDSKDNAGVACPKCKRPIDPLRAPAVSVVGGHIVHFCSHECRESFLDRLPPPAPPPPEPDTTSRGETAEVTGEETSFLPSPSALALKRHPLLGWQVIWVLVFVASWLASLALPRFVSGWPLLAPASFSFAVYIAYAFFHERRSDMMKRIEAMGPAVAAAAIMASSLFGLDFGAAAQAASLLLAIDPVAALLELVGRHRSLVLEAIDGGGRLVLPASWRDNSERALRLRRTSIVLDWARYPLAMASGAAMLLALGWSPESGLLAGASMLMAIKPRNLRMTTGDAHLGVAIAASQKGILFRNAKAVSRLAESDVVLFMAKRSLLDKDRSLVDWHIAEDADEDRTLDALSSLMSDVEGGIAAAVRRFAKTQKARASSPVAAEKKPGLGVGGDTPFGRMLCGSRSFLLAHGIATSTLEDHAEVIESSGRSAVFASMNGRVAAVFGIEDSFKKETKEAVSKLSQLGLKAEMATSAEVCAATALGERLGMETTHACVSEDSIGDLVSRLADSGARVALVGHGPAFEDDLGAAHVAIALGEPAPTQAGIDARQVDATVLPWLFQIAKRAERSADINTTTAAAAMVLGSGLAMTWQSPAIVAAVTAMSALAGVLCTWNAPFPLLGRIASIALAPLRRIARLIRRIRSFSRNGMVS